MPCIGVRLLKHTEAGLVLLGSTVLAPLLLLLAFQLGWLVPKILGLLLLSMGSASLLGATLTAWLPCSVTTLQWRLIFTAVWMLNPLVVAILAVQLGQKMVASWTAMPLALVVSLLSGRARFSEAEPDWDLVPFSIPHLFSWCCLRMIWLVMPMQFLSLQILLYMPASSMLPEGPIIGVLICAGCFLLTAKFCVFCWCLAKKMFGQALVFIMLMGADCFSSIHALGLVPDETKVPVLMGVLLGSGVILTTAALARLKLGQRWRRARMQQVSADSGVGLDVELGQAASLGRGLESSDSDEERGPQSLPEGFHETLAALLGMVPSSQARSRRQFLCAARTAVIQSKPEVVSQGSTGAACQPQASSQKAPMPVLAGELPNVESGSDCTLEPLKISPTDLICAACLVDFQPGERVRPLPKCKHVCHADCLERWVREKKEATTCPQCRKPALARKGAQNISEVMEDSSSYSSSSSSQVRGSSRLLAPARSGNTGSGRLNRAGSGIRRSPGGSQPIEVQANHVQELRSIFYISETLARGALQAAGGVCTVAAHLITEYQNILIRDFSTRGRTPRTVPAGVVEAVREANPNLDVAEVLICRHLQCLYEAGTLRSRPRPWAELSFEGQIEVFRILFEDVSRRSERAQARR